MTSFGDMRFGSQAGRFMAVALLALAVVVTCVTGPLSVMMEGQDVCETLVTATVACNHASDIVSDSLDTVYPAALPAAAGFGAGSLAPQLRRSPDRSIASSALSNFLSIPLRA